MRARWVLLFVLCAVGCRSRVELDDVRLKTEIARRFDQVTNDPEVDKAVDKLWDAVFDAPAVAQRGEALLGKLGEDPALMASAQEIMAKVQALPAMKAIVRRVMKEHPGVSPEEVGDLVAAEVGRVTESPAFEVGVSKTIEQLFTKPELASALREFGSKLAQNPKMIGLIDGVAADVETKRKWRALVTAGGGATSMARATDLLIEKNFSIERLRAQYKKLYAMPLMIRELEAGTTALLDSPAFAKHCTVAVRILLDDPTFRTRAVAAMGVLLSGPSDAETQRTMESLFSSPIVTKALQTFVTSSMADPALGAIGTQIVDRLAGAPEMKAWALELLGRVLEPIGVVMAQLWVVVYR